MAIMEYKFPELGEGIHEGEIVKLHIKPGDVITDEDMIMDVQNDKAIVEVPSPVHGKVVDIKVKEGQVCHVGELVATIEVEGEEVQAEKPLNEAKIVENLSESPNVQPNIAKPNVLATPSVRKLAREKDLVISEVKASGRNGQVTRDDVIAAATKTDTAALTPASKASDAQMSTLQSHEERIPFKGIRKIIADAMSKSMYTAPHVTLLDEVDVSLLVAFREKMKPIAEKEGVKVTYLPFIIKALIAAARRFPAVNAILDEEHNEIVLKKYYNIGIATDTAIGLMVPVIADADSKNIWTLASTIKDLAERGREGKLAAEELKGSTITITNIGSAGGMFFTPIINFPEVAILGTGRISEKPIVKDGQIIAASVMALSLSFDHRVIDGATAQNFLNQIKRLLAEPELLIMEG
ncbi:MAG: dienelactone hydrolase [Bacilli bacterium]|nr:dienelactone hydrolase [Bacilli bacterium]